MWTNTATSWPLYPRCIPPTVCFIAKVPNLYVARSRNHTDIAFFQRWSARQSRFCLRRWSIRWFQTLVKPSSRSQHWRSPSPLPRRTETTFASEIEALVGEAGMRLRSNQYSPQSQATSQRPKTLILSPKDWFFLSFGEIYVNYSPHNEKSVDE